ncbi:hypothetical protein SS50377_25057 [Spironucleus salmonicida]|uniref:Uncharacterized protein n=1 Tax=Spironucleus salmonicida TaxID=348837 RepID=A0A9P8RXJ5_9EUKA|nr:hypothetical protein SS50377_25057 [Spironucleus salmonicida]
MFIQQALQNETYQFKSLVLRAVGPVPVVAPESVSLVSRDTTRMKNRLRPQNHQSARTPKMTVQSFDTGNDTVESQSDIQKFSQNIHDQIVFQRELDGMASVPTKKSQKPLRHTESAKCEMKNWDQIRQDSLKGRRSTRQGRDDPQFQFNDDKEDFIPDENIDWIFK